MINDYSLSKVFYEDLYKAFIFYVEHPRKVFMYKLFMRNIEKKVVKDTFKKHYNANTAVFNVCLAKHL